LRKIVALEDTLSGMKDLLIEEGYDVKSMNEGLGDADAVIVSGMEENVTGVHDRMTDAFVLNADGRRPEEILDDLRRHFELMD
jgi:hypothetical protein